MDGPGGQPNAHDDWIAAHVADFERLKGVSIASWVAIEMALRGGQDSPAEFRDPDVPLIQCHCLEMVLGDGRRCRADTYQDDTDWGLLLTAVSGEPLGVGEDYGGIYRLSQLSELPTGEVLDVNVVEDGEIEEVRLALVEGAVLLVAGEVEEDFEGRLSFHRFDESVLVFSDPDAANGMAWIPPRLGRTSAPPAISLEPEVGLEPTT